ncbi:hypothetical protein [Microbacterium sp. No. 7]|uniref:hypothetical protein n=1 Tax=Microbacterium sp. No. 7 TaxID=1714373 RepID=UPI0006D01C8E|nr:hypothetical protein [Microbacterium sp. No. 7]
MENTTRSTARTGTLRRRIVLGVGSAIAAVGLVFGTATAASATSLYYVHSSWWAANAWAVSDNGLNGEFLAYARLGDTEDWGRRSYFKTEAEASGFDFTHQAIVYRDGKTWKKAQ